MSLRKIYHLDLPKKEVFLKRVEKLDLQFVEGTNHEIYIYEEDLEKVKFDDYIFKGF